MTTHHLASVIRRLDDATPSVDLSSSRSALVRRAGAWTWPAIQMGVAAALAWLIAGVLVADAAGYAPIVAIGALGLGRERRLSRSGLMLAGLFLGVVAAELAGPVIGRGWWQIGLMLAITALVTGAVVDRELAVTYAAINVVVLVTIPGQEGWVPDRMIAGVAGVAVAVAVMLLLLPPRPVAIVTRRLERATRSSIEALEATALALDRDARHDSGTRDGDDDDDGDERPLVAAARRLDDEIERSHESVQQALEVVTWSPLRRRNRAEVLRLAGIAHTLRPALRTASTVARLGDRAAMNDIPAHDHVLAGITAAADALAPLIDALVDGDEPADDTDRRAAEAIEQLLSGGSDHAILIALQEEVRGLLADVVGIVEGAVGGGDTTREYASGGTVEGITYGRYESTLSADG